MIRQPGRSGISSTVNRPVNLHMRAYKRYDIDPELLAPGSQETACTCQYARIYE